MSRFYEIDPSLENYWRAIILFGRNVASYKFALAKALFDLKDSNTSLISLERLAVPYSEHIIEHLKNFDKQGTSSNSRFLDGCRSFKDGKLGQDALIDLTVNQGFNYVIDAFHNVHNSEIPKRFFQDERKTSDGIVLTDDFYRLGENFPFESLNQETEARWRLVEAAWNMNLPKNLIQIDYEPEGNQLYAKNKLRRVPVSSARASLNGYQKGRCFYCYRNISIEKNHIELADVDHFFPHVLRSCDPYKPINGVANLVLACKDCNRGESGKFDRLPSVTLLERLYQRNEYLITSHHPLRETLMVQTGVTSEHRQQYLQDAYNCSTLHRGDSVRWQPAQQGSAIF
jgi:hypothetical protein